MSTESLNPVLASNLDAAGALAAAAAREEDVSATTGADSDGADDVVLKSFPPFNPVS
jgi:hypothetical protein